MADIDALVKQLEDCTDIVKRIFHTAPALVPDQLSQFVFVPKERVRESLNGALALTEDKESFLEGLQAVVNMFKSMVKVMDEKIAERQQPIDLPRREGYKKINQFKKRRGEW